LKLKQKLPIKGIPLRAFLISLLFLLSILTFGILAHEIVAEKEDWFDSRAFSFLKGYSTPAIIQFFRFMTFFGSTWFVFGVYCLIVIYLLVKHRREEAINIAIIAISSSLLLFGLKDYFARHRPEAPLFEALTNYSFPSGHALSSFILCFVLVLLIRRSGWPKGLKISLSILLLIISILIGISRIVLRYHYASDVIAGYCAGFAWVILCNYVMKKFRRS
jgi:membrane-associated phospholipid phosphatase